jgi:hypothetical protein
MMYVVCCPGSYQPTPWKRRRRRRRRKKKAWRRPAFRFEIKRPVATPSKLYWRGGGTHTLRLFVGSGLSVWLGLFGWGCFAGFYLVFKHILYTSMENCICQRCAKCLYSALSVEQRIVSRGLSHPPPLLRSQLTHILLSSALIFQGGLLKKDDAELLCHHEERDHFWPHLFSLSSLRWLWAHLVHGV